MSSSGQAPNVSMDELLASIKSMIEGESNGGASLQPEAEEEAIMDLTNVVQPKAAPAPAPAAMPSLADMPPRAEPQEMVDAVSSQMLPQASEPYRGLSPHDDPRQAEYAAPGAPGGMPQGHAPQQPPAPRPQAGQPEAMMGQHGADRAATPQSQSLQTLVSREGAAAEQAAADAQKHLAEAGSAKEAANQITDLLGAMNDELGFGGATPKTEAVERNLPPAGAEFDPDGLLGDMGHHGKAPAGRDEHERGAGPVPSYPQGGQGEARAAEADTVQPLAQQKNIAPQEMSRGLGLGGAPQPGHPHYAGQPQGQLPQGQVAQGPMAQGQIAQGMPPHQRPAGQPQAEGQPQAHAMSGMNAVGQSPMGGMGQPPAAMGQPHLPNQGIQPSGEMRADQRHDPRYEARRESEYAMGQALSQADASLSVGQVGQAPGQHPFAGAEAQMRGLSQHHGVPGGQQPGHATNQLPVQANNQMPGPVGGQLPAVSNGDGLPVLSAGRGVVPAAAPMMASPEPYADQLPLEMRNNLEEIVKQLLKPLLREWLERNLPDLLRGAVDETGKIDPNRL